MFAWETDEIKATPVDGSTRITFGQLAEEVTAWSRYNFGNNESKWCPGFQLGHVGPLLGVIEELSEYIDGDDPLDAASDSVIYLANFASLLLREDPSLSYQQRVTLIDTPPDRVVDEFIHLRRPDGVIDAVWALGKVFRVLLKSHQGIRGHGSTAEDIWRRASPYLYLAIEALDCQPDIASKWDPVQSTWTDVRCRDWVKYPMNGRDS